MLLYHHLFKSSLNIPTGIFQTFLNNFNINLVKSCIYNTLPYLWRIDFSKEDY